MSGADHATPNKLALVALTAGIGRLNAPCDITVVARDPNIARQIVPYAQGRRPRGKFPADWAFIQRALAVGDHTVAAGYESTPTGQVDDLTTAHALAVDAKRR